MATFNTFQQVKRRFFAMRNGVIADALRSQGAPYKIIFGLNLPQIVEIARDFAGDTALADSLWANSSTRESLLMAPMVHPVGEMTRRKAMEWISTAPSAESIDVLCHRLLRRCDFAADMAAGLAGDDRDLSRYAGLRLRFNLLPADLEEARREAEAEISRGCPLTISVATMLRDEIDYLAGGED